MSMSSAGSEDPPEHRGDCPHPGFHLTTGVPEQNVYAYGLGHAYIVSWLQTVFHAESTLLVVYRTSGSCTWIIVVWPTRKWEDNAGKKSALEQE